MSNELTIIETDTRLGALKQQGHWSIVVAATGAGLTFTWLAHLMTWTPLGFAIHGVAGAVGGYLVGTGISRAIIGARVRRLSHLERVTTTNRVIASGLRLFFGAALFYLSYLWAVGIDLALPTTLDPAMIGFVAPVGIWVVILGVALGGRIVAAMR